LGKTVQVVPHITGAIVEWINRGKTALRRAHFACEVAAYWNEFQQILNLIEAAHQSLHKVGGLVTRGISRLKHAKRRVQSKTKTQVASAKHLPLLIVASFTSLSFFFRLGNMFEPI